MKRQVILGAVLAALIGCALGAWGDAPCEHGGEVGKCPGESGPAMRGASAVEQGHRCGDEGWFGWMGTLNQGELETMARAMEEAWRQEAALRHRLEMNLDRLRRVEHEVPFNEKEAADLAADHGRIVAETVLSHARARNRFLTLMTPDLRAMTAAFPTPLPRQGAGNMHLTRADRAPGAPLCQGCGGTPPMMPPGPGWR